MLGLAFAQAAGAVTTAMIISAIIDTTVAKRPSIAYLRAHIDLDDSYSIENLRAQLQHLAVSDQYGMVSLYHALEYSCSVTMLLLYLALHVHNLIILVLALLLASLIYALALGWILLWWSQAHLFLYTSNLLRFAVLDHGGAAGSGLWRENSQSSLKDEGGGRSDALEEFEDAQGDSATPVTQVLADSQDHVCWRVQADSDANTDPVVAAMLFHDDNRGRLTPSNSPAQGSSRRLPASEPSRSLDIAKADTKNDRLASSSIDEQRTTLRHTAAGTTQTQALSGKASKQSGSMSRYAQAHTDFVRQMCNPTIPLCRSDTAKAGKVPQTGKYAARSFKKHMQHHRPMKNTSSSDEDNGMHHLIPDFARKHALRTDATPHNPSSQKVVNPSEEGQRQHELSWSSSRQTMDDVKPI